MIIDSRKIHDESKHDMKQTLSIDGKSFLNINPFTSIDKMLLGLFDTGQGVSYIDISIEDDVIVIEEIWRHRNIATTLVKMNDNLYSGVISDDILELEHKIDIHNVNNDIIWVRQSQGKILFYNDHILGVHRTISNRRGVTHVRRTLMTRDGEEYNGIEASKLIKTLEMSLDRMTSRD